MKRLVLILLAIFLSLPATALMLHGNAEFNAEIAREQTFRNIKYSFDQTTFQNFWKDPNFDKNYKAVSNGQTKIENRTLAWFSDGTYGVRYDYDPYHHYYYDIEGELFKVDVLDKRYDEYPHRSVAYNKFGAFKNATYAVSEDEQYLYDKNKRLLGHWIGNACYDGKGNVLMLRKKSN